MAYDSISGRTSVRKKDLKRALDRQEEETGKERDQISENY